MRHVSWIITIPLAAVAISFAVSNRETVEVALWPFPATAQISVFIAVLLPALIGFLLGGIVVWLSGGPTRRRARHQSHELDALSRELKERRQQQALADDAAKREAERHRLEEARRASAQSALQERPVELVDHSKSAS